MGQRLNIEILDGEKLLANAYYHWSAYTSSAINLTAQIINTFYTSHVVRKTDTRTTAIRLLESTGAGYDAEERFRIEQSEDEFLKNLTVNDCIDRNRGILSVTDEGMNNTRSWEEGRVSIDISSELVYFDVYSEIEDKDWDEYYDDWHPVLVDEDSFKWSDFEIPFVDISEFAKAVSKIDGIKTTRCSTITWIE